MEGFGLEVLTVAGDEQPMANLVVQKLDGADGREFAAEDRICWIRSVGENQPNAVVSRGFGVVAEHADDSVVNVDGKTGEHVAHLGFQGSKRFQDERMWRLRFGFGRANHDLLQGT